MTSITPTISQLRMLASLRGHQWMVRPDAIQSFALAALDVPEKSNALNITTEDFFELRPEPSITDEIGHVFIQGMLVSSCPPIYEKLGLAVCYPTIQREISGLIDSGVAAIVFHVDSPGGTVAGNIELAKFIQAMTVPTASHCHGLACSAAYKLVSATGFIVANESAQVGNVGTIMSWADCSEFWASNGIEFKALVSEGAELKSTFHLEPDETQLAFLQESIDEAGGAFREFVSSGRSKAGATVDPEVWRAGWYSGEHALSLGLIDTIGPAQDAVDYLRETIKKI